MKRYLLLLLVPLLFILSPVRAEINLPNLPDNGVYDTMGLLSQSSIDKVKTFNATSNARFGVYIVDTLHYESIDDVASDLAEKWKHDSKMLVGNYFAVIMAVEDKTITLKTSAEASDYVDGKTTKNIMDDAISKLKSKDYDGAITSIIDDVAESIKKVDQEKRVEEEKLELKNDPNSNVSDLDPKPNFFNSSQYRGAFYMFSAIILGVYVIPISIPIICFLVFMYFVKKQKKQTQQENTESTIIETKEPVFSNYEERKESSHFDSPFE